MSVFTVAMPGGTKDREYQAYADQLKEWGIDIDSVARVPETGTDRQWLHTWQLRSEAERFAEELQRRTGLSDWYVVEIEDGRIGPSRPPPVTIIASNNADGIVYRLEDADRQRIKRAFPQVNPVESITVTTANEQALRQAVFDPLSQIVILLTGLNAERLGQIGGVQVIDQATRTAIWKQTESPLIAMTTNYDALLEEWLDKYTSLPDNTKQVLEFLANYSIGNGLENRGGVPHPSPTGYEDLLWPWNRAGGQYLDRGMPREAAEIWSGCYLCLLSLQEKYRFRIHKGMPLCNLGIAFLRSNDREMAILSWFLGLVEDTITNPESSMTAQNFNNLLTVNLTETSVRKFAQAIQNRFTDTGVIVGVPELCFPFGVASETRVFDPELVTTVDSLLNNLSIAFPKLPNNDPPVVHLRHVWSKLPQPWKEAAR